MDFSNIYILEKKDTYFFKPYSFPKPHFPNIYIRYKFVENSIGIQLFAEHFERQTFLGCIGLDEHNICA